MILLFLARTANQAIVYDSAMKLQGNSMLSQWTIPNLKFKVYMQKNGYPI